MSCSNVYDISNKVVHGGDVYRNSVKLDYSVNLNPVALPEPVMDAAVSGLRLEMHQYPDPFQQRLKESIADYEGIEPDRIICGSGASELIMAVCHAFLPCKALITAPSYAGYRRALNAVGAEVKEYLIDERSGFRLDEGFADAIEDDTDIVFITEPNNPNGRLIDRDVLEKITEKCEDKGVILVIDECFLPLTERGLEKSHIRGKTLHLRAFTKTFAIPGIRIGYMISASREMLSEIAMHLPEWNVSRIAERTGEAAAKVLAETEYLAESVRMIGVERAYLMKELESLGIKVYESDTNYLLLRSRPDLYDMLLQRGILIRRCANFSGLDDTYFRIAIRRHEDNEQLIGILREII